MANQSQAKRFLQSIGLHPTSIGQNDDNYVSFKLSRDSQESDVVNAISEALKRSGTKRTRDYGPQIHRMNVTLQWVWDVPSKGVIVFYPYTMKVGFANKVDDIPMDV